MGRKFFYIFCLSALLSFSACQFGGGGGDSGESRASSNLQPGPGGTSRDWAGIWGDFLGTNQPIDVNEPLVIFKQTVKGALPSTYFQIGKFIYSATEGKILELNRSESDLNDPEKLRVVALLTNNISALTPGNFVAFYRSYKVETGTADWGDSVHAVFKKSAFDPSSNEWGALEGLTNFHDPGNGQIILSNGIETFRLPSSLMLNRDTQIADIKAGDGVRTDTNFPNEEFPVSVFVAAKQ